METKQTEKAMKEGYRFQGVWISNISTDEGKTRFKERRKELKAEGKNIKTLDFQNGKGLFINEVKE